MIVEKFKPISFSKAELNIPKLNERTEKKWQYACSGKAALYHCLKSLDVRGTVLLPTYVCDSILNPIKRLELSYICYDLNLDDLNVNIDDLEYKLINNDVSCVIIASMYGNPANMTQVEVICRKYNVSIIDDAAQSFEAKCDGRFIGTFGDAGFFSFSPGKATPGHLGAFFWTSSEDYIIKRKNHLFIHLIAYWDFYFNRYRIYRYKKFKIFTLLTYVKMILFKLFDSYNDDINSFEKAILGGILKANKEQIFRQDFLKELRVHLISKSTVRLITLGNDDANNHKIVLICADDIIVEIALLKLAKEGIYSIRGYQLLDDGKNCPNARSIVSRIIEIPLEDSNAKCEHIIKQLNKIFE
ncbi:DegT/DnrJ/EryC1/StrS family aminotransferase [Labilibaculum sp.]|uniref:DegT/DnrJ/EryC1/StrS family aminotransferase n=1 Tax=Labilibaculum sp. TaxID=2060723 RepID=UPI002AA69E8E|nr:DegT/DnrJ/EryC1/StrS family aminotransferase [Labilibaculum sp.]